MILVSAGILLFLGGVAAFLIINGSLVDESVLDMIMPGLLAWLLALLAFGIALLIDALRFVLYGTVLAVAGLITAVREANPGWPMLAAGVVIIVTGATMLIAFTRSNPLEESK